MFLQQLHANTWTLSAPGSSSRVATVGWEEDVQSVSSRSAKISQGWQIIAMYWHVIHSKIELRLSNLVGECWGLFPDRTNGTSHCKGLLACYLHCHPCDLAAHCGKLHAWAQMSYTQSAVKPAIWLGLTWNWHEMKKMGYLKQSANKTLFVTPVPQIEDKQRQGVLGCLKHRDGFCTIVSASHAQFQSTSPLWHHSASLQLNDVKRC